jgi:hypothetical protein
MTAPTTKDDKLRNTWPYEILAIGIDRTDDIREKRLISKIYFIIFPFFKDLAVLFQEKPLFWSFDRYIPFFPSELYIFFHYQIVFYLGLYLHRNTVYVFTLK